MLQFLRGMHRGRIRVGWNGKALLAVDAASREARVDVGAWPADSTVAWMRSPTSLSEAIRGVSTIPRMAKSLNDIEWTVRVDVDGRKLAVLGREGPSISGHIWVSPSPAALADGARRIVRRVLDSPARSASP